MPLAGRKTPRSSRPGAWRLHLAWSVRGFQTKRSSECRSVCRESGGKAVLVSSRDSGNLSPPPKPPDVAGVKARPAGRRSGKTSASGLASHLPRGRQGVLSKPLPAAVPPAFLSVTEFTLLPLIQEKGMAPHNLPQSSHPPLPHSCQKLSLRSWWLSLQTGLCVASFEITHWEPGCVWSWPSLLCPLG